MSPINIHPHVRASLAAGSAVVALESAVFTHGLPREPLPASSQLRAAALQSRGLKTWDADGPAHLEVARAMQAAVRDGGAVPAIVAVIAGTLRIGLDDDELVLLAEERCAAKASCANLSHVMASGGSAGTTVSATLAGCGLTHSTDRDAHSGAMPGIRVFATGGIGGVHRGWQDRPDISADLPALAASPVCVVCCGAKSILDLPATLEALESLGVPVVGFRTDNFPQFQCAGDSALPLRQRVDDARSAARLCAIHWRDLRRRSAIVLANAPPEPFALQAAELERALAAAESLAASRGISGPARTPFLLAEIARSTGGRSLDANIALLLSNARLAAEVAVELARA